MALNTSNHSFRSVSDSAARTSRVGLLILVPPAEACGSGDATAGEETVEEGEDIVSESPFSITKRCLTIGVPGLLAGVTP